MESLTTIFRRMYYMNQEVPSLRMKTQSVRPNFILLFKFDPFEDVLTILGDNLQYWGSHERPFCESPRKTRFFAIFGSNFFPMIEFLWYIQSILVAWRPISNFGWTERTFEYKFPFIFQPSENISEKEGPENRSNAAACFRLGVLCTNSHIYCNFSIL